MAAGLVTGGLAASAQAAHPHNATHAHDRPDSRGSVRVEHRTLTIAGTARSDKLALRLRAGDLQQLQVDVGDDGSADFTVRCRRFDRIVVNAGDGNDHVRIDESDGAFTTTTATQINGERGDYTLLGGSGAGTLTVAMATTWWTETAAPTGSRSVPAMTASSGIRATAATSLTAAIDMTRCGSTVPRPRSSFTCRRMGRTRGSRATSAASRDHRALASTHR